MAAQRQSRKLPNNVAPEGGAPFPDSEGRPDVPPADTLDIAVRAYAEPAKKPPATRKSRRSAPPSAWTLVFDTETTIDASQRLRIGTYRIYEENELDEQGIFYVPDDPLALSSEDIATIKSYARRKRCKLRTVADFVDNVFYQVGYHFRATIVGFNLPFDISRLAIGHDAARAVTITSKEDPEARTTYRNMVGGFTFQLSQHKRPRVLIKHRSSKDAFYQFTSLVRGGRARRGFFVDVKTIAAALLGKPFTLKKLAEELEVEHRKLQEDKHGGPVTEKYLDYAVRDTLATWECFQALRDRFNGYQLKQTPLHTLHSEASLGKAYLKQMGIRPFMEVHPDFPRELLGAIMSSYFGGRSEVHIRRKVTRVLYCDFLSMYPTVSTLMGSWAWVRSQGVIWDDATKDIQALLKSISLADLQNPTFWPSLTTLVQVQPDQDIFPVRAKYGSEDEQYRLALNHLTSKTPLWFTLADCIASTFLTGRPPKVLKAWRFAPRGVQPDLKAIDIAGNPDYRVNPGTEDFYKRLIDLRRSVQKRQKKAKNGITADILKNEQLAIKNVANATTYGIFIELNPDEGKETQSGTCYGACESFPINIAAYEQPGAYFHPLIAVFTTGAARLMLATAEHLAIAAGLTWAFCDTDSMALAKPDDMPEDVFLIKAQSVRDWFTPLNPYTEKGPVFKIEDDNFRLAQSKVTGEIEPLYCYAISPKRYALFNRDSRGTPIIRKALAHGLGHLYAPLESDPIHKNIPKPPISLDDMEIKGWQYSFWYRILQAALAGGDVKPKIDDLPGFKRPATTRYGASTPSILAWCKGFNRGLDYRNQIKPFNFMLRFYAGLILPPRLVGEDETPRRSRPLQLRPIAQFDTDVLRAARSCRDRNTGEHIDSGYLSTYAEELAPYHIHPDSKFLNGQYDDTGFTQRRHVIAGHIHNIGKEADSLQEQLEHGSDPDAIIEYGIGPGGERITRDQIREMLHHTNLSRLQIASGVSRRRLMDVRDGNVVPKPNTLKKIALGLQRMATGDDSRRHDIDALLKIARSERDRIGLRKLARFLGYDHSTVLQVLDGNRSPSAKLLRKLKMLGDGRRI